MNAVKSLLTCSALLMCSASTIWSATIEIPATVAANISDYHEISNGMGGFIIVQDGDGDQFSTAPYPYLAAGTNLSGASGQNGTARFQMEFDLSSLAGMNISSARLVLRSRANPPSQDQRTFFFHVTTDEDGVTTTSDFESPAVYTGLFQDPVAVDSVHEFDVTTFVLADLLAGNAFTSFQGRSDEVVTGVFDMTMEYYRTVPNGLPLGPMLVVETAAVPEPATFALAGFALAAVIGFKARRSR